MISVVGPGTLPLAQLAGLNQLLFPFPVQVSAKIELVRSKARIKHRKRSIIFLNRTPEMSEQFLRFNVNAILPIIKG